MIKAKVGGKKADGGNKTECEVKAARLIVINEMITRLGHILKYSRGEVAILREKIAELKKLKRSKRQDGK